MKLNRREFMQGLGAAALISASAGRSTAAAVPQTSRAVPLVDFHVHLFGVGDGGTQCWFSDTQKKNRNYRYLLRLLDLKENGHLDLDYEQRIVAQLKASSIEKAVLQAWDCRYDTKGERDLLHTTSVYVPNNYLFDVVARHPELFIACASINPKRKDAIEELDECAGRGAKIVKIHPPTMDVDPSTPGFRVFYERCAYHKIIVMFHTGSEHAAEIVGLDNCDPRKLSLALEAGCTVVAAHGGFGAFFDKEDFYPGLQEMVRRYPKLYFDTAVLGSMFRWRNLPRMLKDPVVLKRAIHASDIPFPANALVFWNRMAPSELLSLLKEKNLFERDYRLKRALGLPPEVFERGAMLLADAGRRQSAPAA